MIRQHGSIAHPVTSHPRQRLIDIHHRVSSITGLIPCSAENRSMVLISEFEPTALPPILFWSSIRPKAETLTSPGDAPTIQSAPLGFNTFNYSAHGRSAETVVRIKSQDPTAEASEPLGVVCTN